MEEYQTGVVELVKTHVLKDTAHRNLARSPSMTAEEILRQNSRRDYVTRWTTVKRPLSYEPGAYDFLARALQKDMHTAILGLPWASPRYVDMKLFGKLIYNMGKPKNPTKSTSPLLKNGHMQAYLRVAIAMFSTRIGTHLPPNKLVIDIWSGYIRIAADHLGICFGPGSVGTGPVTLTMWTSFGAEPEHTTIPRRLLNNQEALDLDLEESRQRAMIKDVRATWSLEDTPLRDLHCRLNQIVFPDEWDPEKANLGINDNIIRSTYLWVNNNFDWGNPVHHLAFITAIIFSKALPDVAYPAGAPPDLILDPSYSTETKKLLISRSIAGLSWNTPPGRGLSDHIQIVVMFTTTFIAYHDAKSPLRIELDNKKTIANYAAKHSEYISSNL